MRRTNNNFAILEENVNLPAKSWLAGIELISFTVCRAAGQIVDEKDRFEILDKDFLSAGAGCASVREEVETIFCREEVGGGSLGDPTVNVACNDGIHRWIFSLARLIVKAEQIRIIRRMRINFVTPRAEKYAMKAPVIFYWSMYV